jgi:hypothetical protein
LQQQQQQHIADTKDGMKTNLPSVLEGIAVKNFLKIVFIFLILYFQSLLRWSGIGTFPWKGLPEGY